MPKREPHFRTARDQLQNPHWPRRTPPRDATLAGTELGFVGSPSRAVLEKSWKPKKKPSKSRILIRQWMTWTIGASAAALGFVTVLWLTGPTTAPLSPAITVLTNASVSDATSLMAAVQTAGLRGSSDVKGDIEEIKRVDSNRVAIKGWAVDVAAPSSSLTIVAFAGGKHVLTTVTSGARPEIAKTFGLANASAPNMSFQGTFGCQTGDKVIVLAATSGHAYSQFRSLACP